MRVISGYPDEEESVKQQIKENFSINDNN